MSDELKVMIEAIVQSASDESLAGSVKDAGHLGLLARTELTRRGHEVHYSNVNDVIEASVMLHTPEQAQESVLEDVSEEEVDEPSEELAEPEKAPEEDLPTDPYPDPYPVDAEAAFVSPEED